MDFGAHRRLLLALMVLALALHLWGIRRNLPHTPEVDEPTFVGVAVHIAATGDLNPGWFGHPAGTLFYPLAALLQAEHTLSHGGNPFTPSPTLQTRFDVGDSALYLWGRFYTIAFAVLSVPLLFQVGRMAFDDRTGLIAAWLFVWSPVAMLYAKMVRTDSLSIFFVLLSLWLILRLRDRMTPGRAAVAGLAIGLATATKYYLVALAVLPLALILLHMRDERVSWQQGARLAGAGLLATGAAFFLAVPYFFLDFRAALTDLLFESRSVHPGADGLSRPGNLWWYLSTALPGLITWPQMAFLAGGIVVAWRRRGIAPRLLLGFAVLFLLGISLLALHWQRWLLPILPILLLFVADGVGAATDWLASRPGWQGKRQVAFLLALVGLVTLWPGARTVQANVRLSNPSTRVLARQWIVENVPAGSAIAAEEYTVDRLADAGYPYLKAFALGLLGDPPSAYAEGGFTYMVVSSAMYDRFFADPDRYPEAVTFYEELFASGRLLKTFTPSLTRGGPTIRIYRLPTGNG